MKLLFLADVSGSSSHIGDEAMLDANLDLFRHLLPDCQMEVAAGLGWDGGARHVSVVERLEFSRTSETDRDNLLDQISGPAVSRHLAVQAALSCDALIISGGGNISKSWPHYLYERVAMARLAVSHGAPVILLGQTLGPEFRLRESALVSELLRLSSWTGLRETYSFALALESGAELQTLSYQIDDAAFLKPEPIPPAMLEEIGVSPSQPWIAVTVHPLGEASVHNPLVARVASQLRAIAHGTGASLVFIPHEVSKTEGMPGDVEFGKAIQRALCGNPPLVIAPVLSTRHALWLTQQASLVISSRYHPLVFATTGCVPAVGFWTDEYTRRKLTGAMIHVGWPDNTTSLEDALSGKLAIKALDLWQSRDEYRARARERVLRLREAEQLRIQALGRHIHDSLPINSTTPGPKRRFIRDHPV